ncbi:MAG: GNAT family N-acetyltransferase [Anaerolineae bacterium]|nr:GNAT family N-acetyltransferase [Anaerolineae bacterium]
MSRSDVFEVARILVDHAGRAHPGDIAIIAYYGSHAKGAASPDSDLDLFYIPDEGKAKSLCTQFVLKGLPYDFWPVSWRFAESIANAESGRPWAVAASLIADARVLYHRSPDDLARFEALQQRIATLCQPESRAVMVQKGLDAFNDLLVELGQMQLAGEAGDEAGLRWAGWRLVNHAANCLALINQTYFSKGWGSNWQQIAQLAEKPAHLMEMMQAVVLGKEPEQLHNAGWRLARAVRRTLLTAQAATAEPSGARQELQDFYFFIVEYQHKVLSACARGDAHAAGYAAFQMQEELCEFMNKAERGFYGWTFNLLGEYSTPYHEAGFPDLIEPAASGDLATLAGRARRLGETVKAFFARHDIPLNVVKSPEALKAFLQARDPLPEGKTADIIVKRFVPDQAQAVSDLIRRNLREINCRDYPPETIESLVGDYGPENILEAANEQQVFVAVDGDAVAGTAALADFGKDGVPEFYAVTVFVQPERHGEGIGRQLMEAVEAQAQALGAAKITVRASITAKDFYRTLGYRFKEDREILDEHRLYRMEKALRGRE